MQGTGIFGGSFNPIHNGHIALAKTLLNVTGLDEIWFMVSPQNPLKQQAGLLDDTTRLEMARTALTGEPQLAACDYEFYLTRSSVRTTGRCSAVGIATRISSDTMTW